MKTQKLVKTLVYCPNYQGNTIFCHKMKRTYSNDAFSELFWLNPTFNSHYYTRAYLKNSLLKYISLVCHRFPIATLCYIVLLDFLSLAFALIRCHNKGNNVWNRITPKGDQTAKNPLFARLSWDFINKIQHRLIS